MKKLVIFAILCLMQQSCLSEGVYFQLDELNQLVKKRTPHSEVVQEFGQARYKYSEEIFVARLPGEDPRNEPQLLVQQIDGAVFSALEGAGQEESDYSDKDPWARPEVPEQKEIRLAAKTMKAKNPTKAKVPEKDNSAAMRPHFTETIQTNYCENPRRKIKYHGKRKDLNGYLERQYTLIYLDGQSNVCGFMTRSLFSPH